MNKNLNELYDMSLWFISKVPAGQLAGCEAFNRSLSFSSVESHWREIKRGANPDWVVDLDLDLYLIPGFLSILDSELRWVNAIQASLSAWVEGGRRTVVYSIWKSCMDDMWEGPPEDSSEPSVPSYAVAVSALVLLSLVYHYLTGNVDRGGSRAYSRSSLDFRDIYVPIVLFLGAYVWIKFREAACRGVHRRELPDKQGGTKVVYEARLKPPMWNGENVPRLDLGRFATPQEAHNKFLIAAFYYNRDAGLLDGWFQVPPMSEEERSLTGVDLRAWVIVQAKKVYEDFKMKEAEAALFQELFEACEVQATPGHNEVNVDPCGASLLNSAEHQQAVLASQAENSGMGMAMLDNHGLECASHSLDRTHEGLALPNGHSVGFGEESALPVSQLPPNTESGMSLNVSDQLGLLQTLVRTLQQQVSLQQQKIQEFGSQILLLQHQQQFQESRIQNPHWPFQFGLQQQQQQLRDVNQGFPSLEVEMEEQSMQEHIYSCLMASPPHGEEFQEGFSELDTLLYV